MSKAYPKIGTINRTVIYLKSHHRRPVRTSLPFGLYDRQAYPPTAWCPRCGKEMYEDTCCCSSHREGAMYDV